jgi:hypothetical protein
MFHILWRIPAAGAMKEMGLRSPPSKSNGIDRILTHRRIGVIHLLQ